MNRNRLLGACSVGAVLVFAVALGAFKVDAGNPDIFWHLRTGELIVAEGSVPRTDAFNFFKQGLEWIDSQWLFQVVLYGFYRLFGETGFNVLTMLATALIAALMMSAAVGPAPKELRALAGVLLLLAINPRIYPRPELLSCCYMAAMFFLLERARQGRPMLLLPVLFIQLLFANSEGLWPIGFAIIFAYGLDAAWTDYRDRRLAEWKARLAPWALASVAGALVNLFQPYGLRGFTFPFVLLIEILHPGTAHKNVIGEFAPIYTDPRLFRMSLPFLALMAVSLAGALLSGRKVRPALTLLSLVMAWLAVSAFRNIGVGGVMLGGLLMAHLPTLLERRSGWDGWQRAVRVSGVATIGLALVFSLLAVAVPVRKWDATFKKTGLGVDWKSYPVEPVRFLKAIGYQGGIINPDFLGGYLIWSGWPEWKVMADPRMEVGGEEAILNCFRVYKNMEALEEAARKFNADAVVMSSRPPYAAALRKILADRRWALVRLDRSGWVFLHRGSGWDDEIERYEIADPLQYDVDIN